MQAVLSIAAVLVVLGEPGSALGTHPESLQQGVVLPQGRLRKLACTPLEATVQSTRILVHLPGVLDSTDTSLPLWTAAGPPLLKQLSPLHESCTNADADIAGLGLRATTLAAWTAQCTPGLQAPAPPACHAVWQLLNATTPVQPPSADGHAHRLHLHRALRQLQLSQAALLAAPGLGAALSEADMQRVWDAYDAVALATQPPPHWPAHAHIPRLVHMSKADSKPGKFPPHAALTVLSAFTRLAPDRILFRTSVVPTAATWHRVAGLVQVLPLAEDGWAVRGDGSTVLLHLAAHMTDMLRARVLAAQGGVWLDWDIAVLRPFDDLLSAPLPRPLRTALGHTLPAGTRWGGGRGGFDDGGTPTTVLAREEEVHLDGQVYPPYVGVAVLLSTAKASLPHLWATAMPDAYDPHCYTCASTQLLSRLIDAEPGLVVELPWTSLYAPGWTLPAMHWLRNTSAFTSTQAAWAAVRGQHSIHLFSGGATWNAAPGSLELLTGPPKTNLDALLQDTQRVAPRTVLVAANTPALLLRLSLEGALCPGQSADAGSQTSAGDDAHDLVSLLARLTPRQLLGPKDAVASHGTGDPGSDPAMLWLLDGGATLAPPLPTLRQHMVWPEGVLAELARQLQEGGVPAAHSWLCGAHSSSPSPALQGLANATRAALVAALRLHTAGRVASLALQATGRAGVRSVD